MTKERPRNIANDILDCVETATSKWTRQKKSEERHPGNIRYRASRMTREPRTTQKEAAWSILEDAYMAASGNGRLPALARQIFYQARPKIMAMTDDKELQYGYFSQTLLPDYIEENGVGWNVARAIVGDAVKSGLSELIVETLIDLLAEGLGVKKAIARKFWKDAENQIRADAESAKANAEPTAEERATLKQEDTERRRREAEAERACLWNSCKAIAESPALLAEMEAVVHRLGVVGEGAAIRGAYLTASSRLNRRRAMCLLRRGAASGGKNFLIDKTLALIPKERSHPYVERQSSQPRLLRRRRRERAQRKSALPRRGRDAGRQERC